MESFLNDLVVSHVFAFMLIFMRLGMAMMIMPGIGESFVSPQVRLHFALAMSFVLTPFLATQLPPVPTGTVDFVALLLVEAFIGLFIGTVMRIMISALDTAGMVVSMQIGFGSAQMFNPVTAAQGSLGGAVYSTLGVTLLLATNMHHYMLASIADSYQLFPAVGKIPDIGAVAEVISNVVNVAFKIGVQLAIPFLIVGTLLQVGFGLLGRLMPQIQIFFLALPMQILLGLVMLAMVLSAGVLYWMNNFEKIVTQSISL